MDRLRALGATHLHRAGTRARPARRCDRPDGVILMVRRSGPARSRRRACRASISREHWRLIVALVLGLGFAIGLVGHGLPFWLRRRSSSRRSFRLQFAERRRDGTLAARRRVRGRLRRSSRASPSTTCSRTCSWSGALRSAMLDGLIGFFQSLGGFLTASAIGYALISSLVGFIIGALPGLTATMGVALMTTLTHHAAAEPRAADPDVHLCRRDLWRQPQRDPAQYSGHAGLGCLLPRRPRARQTGPGRPRHGHRHVRARCSAPGSACWRSRSSRRCSARWR